MARRLRPVAGQAEHDAKVQADKKAFLEELSKGTVAMNAAAQKVGRDQATIWRWRKADAEFDAAVVAARDTSDDVRVAMAEDSLFARIVSGKASPAETIFFLVNRGKGRWRHIQTIQHADADGGKLPPVTVRVVREERAIGDRD